MYKDTYSQEDVNKILLQINESIDREIDEAIKSNYDAINFRGKVGRNTVTDPFCCTCYGKIYALEGIRCYISDMIGRLLGVQYE